MTTRPTVDNDSSLTQGDEWSVPDRLMELGRRYVDLVYDHSIELPEAYEGNQALTQAFDEGVDAALAWIGRTDG